MLGIFKYSDIQRSVTDRTHGLSRTAFTLYRFMSVAFVALFFSGAVLSAPVITLVDDAGADDEPGQKDLTQLTIDYNPGTAGEIAVTWNWDETGSSGANTLDACSLYDTDGDGFANASLCVISGDDPSTYQNTVLYTCTDTRADRCSGPIEVTSDGDGDGVLDDVNGVAFGSSCNTSINPTNPFNPGEDDNVASCIVTLSDIGENAFLTNVCSYPSQQPNSDPSDCVIAPNSGFLTIVKVADPDDATVTFSVASNISANDGDSSWTVNGNGNFVELETFEAAGGEVLINLTESVPANWELTAAECAIQSSNVEATGSFSGTQITDVKIRVGLQTVCTFTNELIVRDVKLTKQVDGANAPAGAQFDVSLTCDGVTESYSLGDGESGTFPGVPVGAICSADETDPGADWIVALPAPDLVVTEAGPNELIIVNTYDAKRPVTITKQIEGANAPTGAEFDVTLTCDGVSESYTLGNNGTETFSDVPVGAVCSAGETDPGDDWMVSLPVDLTVSADGPNGLTIVNTYDARRTVTLTKLVEGSNAPTDAVFDITLDCGGTTDTAEVGNGGSVAVDDVPVGTTCTATEVSPGNEWFVTFPANLTVTADGPNALTITNTFVPTYLTLVKEFSPLNGAPTVPASAFELSANSVAFSQDTQTLVAPGDYTLAEQDNTNTDFWTLLDLSCNDGSTTSALDPVVSLEAGDNITCTFTNRDTGFQPDGYLQVVKVIEGGDADCGDFAFTISPSPFNGIAWSGTGPICESEPILLQTGTYSVTEDDFTVDYTKDESACASVEVTSANTPLDPAVCTITNTVNQELYPTRTIGYWKTHPEALRYYLAENGSIGFCGDNSIEVDANNDGTLDPAELDDAVCDAVATLSLRGGGENNAKRQSLGAALNCAAFGCNVEPDPAAQCTGANGSTWDDYNSNELTDGLADPEGHGLANRKFCR